MSEMIVKRHQDGTFEATTVFLVTCGCGDVVPSARQFLRLAGVPDVPMVVSTDNNNVKGFISQIGLDKLIPALNKNRHSVIYNPFTKRFIDLLNAPETQKTYDNIYTVVRGE